MNKEIVKLNFSRYASLYDNYATVQKKVALMLKKFLPKDISYISSILEIGCGTGNFTKILVEKYPYSKIVAVDISEEMIEVAREKVSQRKNINFIVADIENFLPFEKFELITSNATLQWLDDLGSFLPKIIHYLTENGRVVFSVFGRETYSELSFVLKKIKGPKITLTSETFINYEKLENELKKNLKRFELEEKRIIKKYNSLSEVLRTIKYTGTRGKGLNFLVTPSFLSKIESSYLENFGGFYATYQIFIVEGEK